jgi:hypothetical protein
MFVPPQGLLRLIVTRNGQLIRPETGPEDIAGITLALIDLKPHMPTEITSLYWLSIRKWGYVIREPGDYAIRAIPFMYDQRGHLIQDTTDVRSNKAQFVVRPRSSD